MTIYHPVDLCQPDGSKSCGACCGLYNWTDHSRRAIQTLLNVQTDLFHAQKDFSHLDKLRSIRDSAIHNKKLFETIYNCEFLGFVDAARKKVGCMLHPSVTGRPELRDHCFYGTKICNEHFCPSYSCLTTSEQRAVIHSVNDWYLYGLIITDIDLVKNYFEHVENSIGESIKINKFHNNALHAILSEFFKLKENWPFKSSDNRLGKYYFSKTEYNIARIEYEKRWGILPSRFNRILVSLESDFKTKRDLEEAERIIQQNMDCFIQAYNAC